MPFIIYFVVISVSVKVDKVPYSLQFCDTAGQVSRFCFEIIYFDFTFPEICCIYVVILLFAIKLSKYKTALKFVKCLVNSWFVTGVYY